MGATTPGKPVKGEPPKGKGEGGPKVTPAPLPPVADPFLKPSGEKAGPGLFGQLLDGIKKTDKFRNRGPGGLGGFPGDLPSEILNPPRPTMPGFVDPSFDRDRFEKVMKGKGGMQAPDYTPRSAYKDEMESVLRESKGSRTDDVVNRIKEIEERERGRRAGRSPNRFPMGGNERDDSPFSQERFDRYQAGFRPKKKEAVFFGERKPSSESKRPTKGGMKKAGSAPSPEAKSKFEEMLAYMKSFQR